MSPLLSPQALSDHLFVVYAEFPHCDSGNVYLITGRRPTLIDCGSRRAAPQLRENIAAAGIAVTDLVQVVATHGDCDHIQGYHDLRRENPALRLLLHEADWPLVREHDLYRNGGYLYRAPFMPIATDRCEPLRDGDRLPAGDGELHVLHTPGHTEGSVCLLGEIDGRQVLFAGDTIGGAMRGLDGADLAIWAQAARDWARSLQRIDPDAIDWVLNGHEPVTSLPLSRERLVRSIAAFGKMMNPWFFLAEPEEEGHPAAGAVSGALPA